MSGHPGEFDGIVAVVTGGASGIGAAVALRLRSAGASVVIADLTVTEPGGIAVDVTDTGSAAAFAAGLRSRFGRCDLLVNSAGAVAVGTVLECSEQEWDRVFDVNVRGVWQMCRHLLPLMGAGAAVVNVASAAGLRPIPSMAAYVASKSALIGLTRAMALDHAPQQIRVNCVCPGLVDTPLAANTQRQRPAAARRSAAAFEGYLIKRLATADEIAACVCHLGSPQASYITGAAIAADGGRTLH